MTCAMRQRRVHQQLKPAARLSRMSLQPHVAAARCSTVMQQNTLTEIAVIWYRTMLQQQLTAAPSVPAQHRSCTVAVVAGGAVAAVAASWEILEVSIACAVSIAWGRKARADEE